MDVANINAFQAFRKNGVHRERWPQVSYAVLLFKRYPCGHINKFMTRRINKNVHAEDEVISYLEKLLLNNELWPPRITLFLTASPCHRCSLKIINFLDMARQQHGVSLVMEVVFSAFYRIRRPSCEQNPACSGHLPSYVNHKSGMAGLKKLYSTHDVVLRTFQSEDWRNLEFFLRVRTSDSIDREKEDTLMRKDFEQLLGPVLAIFRIIFLFEFRTDLCAVHSRTALNTDQSRMALNAGQSRRALTAGQSRRALTAGQSRMALTAGQSRMALNAGQSRTDLTFDQLLTALTADQSLAADAELPSITNVCVFFVVILLAYLLWILLQRCV